MQDLYNAMGDLLFEPNPLWSCGCKYNFVSIMHQSNVVCVLFCEIKQIPWNTHIKTRLWKLKGHQWITEWWKDPATEKTTLIQGNMTPITAWEDCPNRWKMFSKDFLPVWGHSLFVFPSRCKVGNACVNWALTVREGEDGVDAKIQSWQALQGGQLILRVLSGGGPATTHHTAGVDPAVTLDTAASRGLWEHNRKTM